MKLSVPLIDLGTVPVERFIELKKMAEQFTIEAWNADTERQDSFRCHRDTQAIFLVFGRNMNDRRETPVWSGSWRSAVLHALDPFLRQHYGDGEIVRSCLVNLLPRGKVLEHKDDTEEILLYTHRIHLPLKTNEQVDFMIEAKRYHLEEGHLYEFSNQVFHHVVNRSDESRIHLVFDYMERAVLDDFMQKHREAPPKVWKTSYGDPAMADPS